MALFFKATTVDDEVVIVNFEAVRTIRPRAAGMLTEIVLDNSVVMSIDNPFEQVCRALTPIDFTKSKVSESDLGYDPIL